MRARMQKYADEQNDILADGREAKLTSKQEARAIRSLVFDRQQLDLKLQQ